MKIVLSILCLALASCAATPSLHPSVIYATPQGAYVIDVLLLPADGTAASLTLPHH
jgi:hypothetical protein